MAAAFFYFSPVFGLAGVSVRNRFFSVVSGISILLFLYGGICDIIAVARDARKCFTAFYDKSGSRPLFRPAARSSVLRRPGAV